MATKALSRILVRLAAVWVVLFLVFREMVMYATVTSVPEPPPTRMSDSGLVRRFVAKTMFQWAASGLTCCI